jgi:transposase
MLDAIVNGDVIVPEHLANLAKGRLRTEIPNLTKALNGRITKHHRNIIKKSLSHLLFLEQSIAEIEADMEQYFDPHKKELELLDTIPGVGPTVAKVILAELGKDMSVFPSQAHISSWAALCPGNNESAGKKKVHTPLTAIKH